MATGFAIPASAARQLGGLAYQWQALFVVVLGTFMSLLNMTIVNVALPRIIQVFESTVDEGQLVITGYTLAMAVMVPVSGYAADTFGTKRTYLTSIGVTSIASALCCFAPSMEGLIAFRVLQGMSGGMIMTLGMSILFQVTPPRERGSVMGLFGLPVLVAPMLGPIIGGYLVEYVDWRLIFGLSVPFGVLAVMAGAAILRETPRRRGTVFDWPGFVLSAVGFSSALVALSRAPTDGWTAPNVIALWLVAAAAIPCFIVVELSRDQPLLDLSVLRDRTYLLSTLVTCVFMLVMMASALLLPLFLQSVRGLGPMETGLLMFPEPLASAIMMPISGRLLDKVGPRPLIIPGLLILAFAYWLLSALDPSTPDETIRFILVLRGLAMGSVMMPAITIAMDTIAPPKMPRATALGNVMRQMCGAFGTAVFASLLINRQLFHQAHLMQSITSTSITAIQTLATAKLTLIQQGVVETVAETMGLAALARQVSQAAQARAFDDCFYVASLLVLAGLVPVFFLHRTRRI